MKLISNVAALLFAILFLQACIETGHVQSDSDITDSVKAKLSGDPTLASAKIDVDTDDGVVHLKGKVIGQNEATRAVLLTREVDGVVSVDSKLEIDTHITNPDVTARVEHGEEAAEKRNESKKDESDKP